MRRENCFQHPEYLLMVFPFPGTIEIGHRQMKTPKKMLFHIPSIRCCRPDVVSIGGS